MLDLLWTATWQGLALLAVVALICRVATRLGPSYRQALWWTALLKFPLGLCAASPIVLPLLPPSAAVFSQVTPVPMVPLRLPTAEGDASEAMPSAVGILLAVWILGVVFFVGLGIRDGLRARRLVRDAAPINAGDLAEAVRVVAAQMGLRRPPRTALAAGITSPLVAGLFRPTLLLPENIQTALTSEERRMALAHELSHLRRGDLWCALGPAAARVLFWFLPPIHWAVREWATEREAACDAEAIAVTHTDARDYGRMLLRIVAKDRMASPAAALGATAGFHTLKRRLAMAGVRDRNLPLAALAFPILLFLPWRPVAAASGETGELVNPGLEAGRGDRPRGWQKGPRIHSVRYVWDREHAHLGRASLGIFKTADAYFPIAEWTQSVRPDPRRRFIEVTAWVRAEAMHKAVLDVQFAKADGVASHAWVAYVGAKELGDPPADHDWMRVGGTVAVPAETEEIVIAPQVYGPGKVWFDDIEVRFVDRASPTGGLR